MDKVETLFDKIKDSPKKAVTTIKDLFNKTENDMSGTKTFMVPEEYSFVVEKFNSGDDFTEDELKKVKELLKPSGFKKIAKAKNKVEVKCKMGKVKKAIIDGMEKCADEAEKASDNKSESKEEKLDESFSLLSDSSVYHTEAAEAAVGMSLGVVLASQAISFLLFVPIAIYMFYVHSLAVEEGTMNILDDDTTGAKILNAAIGVFFFPVWVVLLHIKINKKKKEREAKSTNESLENDSILNMMESDHEHSEVLRSNDSDNDSELIEAYRKVVSDLTKRVPDCVDPAK